MTTKKTVRTPKRLPDDACPKCATIMKERRGAFRHRVNEEDIKVAGITHLHCPSCGEVVFRMDELRQLREGAQTLYREKYGLLSPVEIRAIRERLALTQAEFAALLHLGANTVSRWEADRHVQTAAMDMLLRLIRDVPQNVAYLRKHAA